MPNQFGIETEQERRARLVNERMMADGIPPLDIIPQATPVGALKNRTALQHQYAPEATNILENSPVNLRFTAEPSLEGTTGHYRPTEGTLGNAFRKLIGDDRMGSYPGGIVVEGGTGYNQESTLAHEFAHLWEDQIMTPETRAKWRTLAPKIAGDYAQERVSGDYEGLLPWEPEKELYATATEQGPAAIPEDFRQKYYGMYRDNITEPPPPTPMAMELPTLDPDRLRKMREQYYGTANWVPEQGVRGYTANGIPNPKLGVPTLKQWNPYFGDYVPYEGAAG
jgi:hypothetical protein